MTAPHEPHCRENNIQREQRGQEDAEPGPICLKLLKALKDIQQGKIHDQFGWNVEIRAPPGDFVTGPPGLNGTVHEGDIDELP